VAVIGETSVGNDRSLWTGASAAARMRWGRLRVGPLARFAATIASGSSPALYREDKDAELGRLAAELLVTADRPIPLGPLWLSPGVAVGAGWVRSKASHEEEATVVHALGPRAEARLTLTIPFGPRLGLDVGLGVGLTPRLEAATSVQDDFTLPAAPPAQLRGGFGLRYGLP
jgi:hypothetical protein